MKEKILNLIFLQNLINFHQHKQPNASQFSLANTTISMGIDY